MGLVTEFLLELIIKQVQNSGLVVWYDPERHYSDAIPSLASRLDAQDIHFVLYSGSFFELRHEIEPYMSGHAPPMLVVYVPMSPSDTHNAMIEAEAGGVVLKPGQQPPTRNTRLSLIARNSLKQTLGEGSAAAIEKQVDAGRITLAELDALAEKGESITKGLIAIIFGTANPEEVTLQFMATDDLDPKIVEKSASPELVFLTRSAFGIELPKGESLQSWRSRLANHILLTDLAANIEGEIPGWLATVRLPEAAATRKACVQLARTWRLRHDLRQSYIHYARNLEKEFHSVIKAVEEAEERSTDQLAQEIRKWKQVHTLPWVEDRRQRLTEALLKDCDLQSGENFGDLCDSMAQESQSNFWSENDPVIQARWALIGTAAQLVLTAAEIKKEIKSKHHDAQSILDAYTRNENPWCLLDTHQRHLERRCHGFDFDLDERHEDLQKLIAKARQSYMEVGSDLAEHFARQFEQAGLQLDKCHHQTDIFEKVVKPSLEDDKTAYIWVDALRFEMARELSRTLSSEYELEIEPALAGAPTITEIGMACMLPGMKGKRLKVVPAGEGKVAIEVNGQLIKDRKDRLDYLRANAGVKVFDCRLDELIPSPRKNTRAGIQEARLILVTSQEIDALCEGDNIPLARRTMDGILHELHRLFRILFHLGVKKIVLTSDHGYLFGDELESDMKIDPPGGETVDLHRRVWVGRGGTTADSYLRAHLADFGFEGDLDIAAPWNFACFKVKGGARAYFHGGLSPQEVIIPVVTLKPMGRKVANGAANVQWSLVPGSEKITTRFFSVQVQGECKGQLAMGSMLPPKMRIEIRAGREVLSTPVSASYGFQEATGDVQMRMAKEAPARFDPNTVTLMITKEVSAQKVSVHLIDVGSGTEQAKLESIQVVISI
jgi:hypothetical protein